MSFHFKEVIVRGTIEELLFSTYIKHWIEIMYLATHEWFPFRIVTRFWTVSWNTLWLAYFLFFKETSHLVQVATLLFLFIEPHYWYCLWLLIIDYCAVFVVCIFQSFLRVCTCTLPPVCNITVEGLIISFLFRKLVGCVRFCYKCVWWLFFVLFQRV